MNGDLNVMFQKIQEIILFHGHLMQRLKMETVHGLNGDPSINADNFSKKLSCHRLRKHNPANVSREFWGSDDVRDAN